MKLRFEVRDTDLLGRVATLCLGTKRLETPCLLPVVHPVSQSIPPKDLESMGFHGLMTNSYILRSRRREEALRVGVHGILGYDGVVMTDSGGYQVLEYGDLGVRYEDVASFQSDIGSDIAVTLDRPTGYPQKRAVAKESVDYSLKNALATLEGFGESETVWVGPVQGGLHLDLVKKSAKGLVGGGFQMLALGSPVQVMQNYMYADLARMVIAAKTAAPYSVPLHLFGAGHPLTMAMAVALGCDTFDSASYMLYARRGRYMTPSGVSVFSTMEYLPCSCAACARTSVREILELKHAERTKVLATHNLGVLRAEVEACKEAIVEGRLWDLVVEKSMAHPALRGALSVLAENSDMLAEGTPRTKDRGLFVRAPEDVSRPEFKLAEARLARSFRRSSKRAMLVVGGLGPTTRVSKRTKDRRAGFDVYKLHPVLGPYPAELDFNYPFAQTVAASELDRRDEEAGAKKLRRMGYRSVTVVGRKRSASTR